MQPGPQPNRGRRVEHSTAHHSTARHAAPEQESGYCSCRWDKLEWAQHRRRAAQTTLCPATWQRCMHAWAAQLAARVANAAAVRVPLLAALPATARHAQIERQTDDWEKSGTHQVCLCGAGSCQRCQQGRGTEAQQLRDRCTGAAAVLSQDAAAGTIRPAPRHPQSALMVLMHSEQNAPIHACCCISGSH